MMYVGLIQSTDDMKNVKKDLEKVKEDVKEIKDKDKPDP